MLCKDTLKCVLWFWVSSTVIFCRSLDASTLGDTVYVDAVRGSDSNGNGSLTSPLLTLAGARDRIRVNRTAADESLMRNSATVRLRGAVRMSEPFVLGSIDSDTMYGWPMYTLPQFTAFRVQYFQKGVLHRHRGTV